MPSETRVPENVDGKYFVTAACIDCDTCRCIGPAHFRRSAERGYSYVCLQPATPAEVEQVEEAMQCCPVGAIVAEDIDSPNGGLSSRLSTQTGGAEEVSILGINGSLRERSCSFRALEHAMNLVSDMGCKTEIFDVRSAHLPFCNGNRTDPRPEFPEVSVLRRLVSNAHGLILATPEYHGGMSGVLKNVLDLLDIEHLEGKVVGCISVLGGQQNSNALNDLRQVIRWCHGWVIPEQVAIPRSADVLSGNCDWNAELLERFGEFASSLVLATRKLAGLHPVVAAPRPHTPVAAPAFQAANHNGIGRQQTLVQVYAI